MSNLLEAKAAEVVAAVRRALTKAVEPLTVRLDALERSLRDLPAPEKGEKGDIGEKGESGVNGKDGADGLNGKDGRDGIDGKDGAPGERGEPGSRGEPGERGEKGVDGREGKDGRDGRDGKDGSDGRDAAHIDPLSEIDEARSYAKGTWATHRGGLWLARQSTDGKTGWDCIVDGLHELVIEPTSERSFKVSVIRSSGFMVEKTMTLPAVIYRGIWKEGETYERGDSTTLGGSTWVLMADEQKGKPGEENTGWLLSCKKGRDGKDGLRGEKGDRGVEGRAGADLTQMGPDGGKWR